MSINTFNKVLLKQASEIAWKSKSIKDIIKPTIRRKNANEYGIEATKCTLNLIRADKQDIALETGITATHLFLLGGHYSQVISTAKSLSDMAKQTRFQDDILYYIENASESLENPNLEHIDGKLDALYRIIWEKGVVGTSNAINAFQLVFDKKITNPTINSYSKRLKWENRIHLIGGPTGYALEMFINQSISLSRSINYGKMAYFTGKLIERGPSLFNRLWSKSNYNQRIYEVANGNDPRLFAILNYKPSTSRTQAEIIPAYRHV